MIESPQKADRKQKEKARNPHDSWLFWQGQKDLNPRHAVLETAALPAELYPYFDYFIILPLLGPIVNCFLQCRNYLKREISYLTSYFWQRQQ